MATRCSANLSAIYVQKTGHAQVSEPVGFDTITLPKLFQGFAGVKNPCQNRRMEIGYARVSRGDSQDLDPQLRALTDAGCAMIYQEEASGGQADRPELARAIGALKSGDVLTVWKLDRLSRSLRDLLFTLEAITAAGAGFRSVTEAIDTTTAPGRLMTQMLGAFAEFERAMIRERTMNGLAHSPQSRPAPWTTAKPYRPSARRDHRQGRIRSRLPRPARQPVPRVALDRAARVARSSKTERRDDGHAFASGSIGAHGPRPRQGHQARDGRSSSRPRHGLSLQAA